MDETTKVTVKDATVDTANLGALVSETSASMSKPLTEDSRLAWHFAPNDGKTQAFEGSPRMPIVVGVPLAMAGAEKLKPKVANQGMHGCERAMDAMRNRSGMLLCRVRIDGDIDGPNDDIICGRNRTVLWMLQPKDARGVIIAFYQALSSRYLEKAKARGLKIEQRETDPRVLEAITGVQRYQADKTSITSAELGRLADGAWAACNAAWDDYWSKRNKIAAYAAAAAAAAAAYAAAYAYAYADAYADADADAAARSKSREESNALFEELCVARAKELGVWVPDPVAADSDAKEAA